VLGFLHAPNEHGRGFAALRNVTKTDIVAYTCNVPEPFSAMPVACRIRIPVQA